MKKLLFLGAFGVILLVGVSVKLQEAIAPPVPASQLPEAAPASPAQSEDKLEPLKFDQMGDI